MAIHLTSLVRLRFHTSFIVNVRQNLLIFMFRDSEIMSETNVLRAVPTVLPTPRGDGNWHFRGTALS